MAKNQTSVIFAVDLKEPTVPFFHFWEHTVGSGHATLALRADWQNQLKRCHDELGFEHVRFHGIFSDDVGTLICQSDKLVYSFFNSDQIFDFLLSIGMKPFLELSFMPSTLASGGTTVFHYRSVITPPKDYGAWGELITRAVTHWCERYGVEEVRTWFFEVWNEPNLKAFWTGSQADYFSLYQTTANAIKGVDASLKVGGPATADNAWISEFVSFGKKSNTPIDFISTHQYPTDSFGKPGDDTVTQLAESHRSVLQKEQLATKAAADGKPIYYTEWCTSSNPFDDLHDQPYAAAFIVKTVMEARGILQGQSYWTFSDIFEENYFSSKAFHGGFGILNIYGLPKPAYRAYELLHQLGDEWLEVVGTHATVDAWATVRGTKLVVMIGNSALPRHPCRTENVEFVLAGAGVVRSAQIRRIDVDHANVHRAWVEMGSPESLLPAQVSKLEIASRSVGENLPVETHGEGMKFKISALPQSVALVTVEFE